MKLVGFLIEGVALVVYVFVRGIALFIGWFLRLVAFKVVQPLVFAALERSGLDVELRDLRVGHKPIEDFVRRGRR